MATDCSTCCDHRQVQALVARYAQCLDSRDWTGLREVFTSDVSANYGGRDAVGLESLIRWIRRFLDGCGASQHLIGFVQVSVDGDHATSETQVRVMHRGAGNRASLAPYESIGSYHDELVRTTDGWRIASRIFDVRIEFGDRAVLAPASDQEHQ